MNDNARNNPHPEQDPVEGSPEIINRELKRQDNEAGRQAAAGKPLKQEGTPLDDAGNIIDRERERQDRETGQRAAAGRPVDPTPLPLEERPQINQKK